MNEEIFGEGYLNKDSMPARELLQNMPFGMLILDRDLNIEWVNDNIFQFAVVKPEHFSEVAGKNIMGAKLFRDASLLKEIIKLKEGLNFEKQIENSDLSAESPSYTRIKGRPFFKDSEFVGGMLIIEEYTLEQKTVQEEYFRSDNLNSLIKNIYDAYFITDETGMIKYIPKWNKLDYFSFPKANVPKKIFDIFPGNSSLKIRRIFEQLNSEKTRMEDDLTYARFEGDLIFNTVFVPFIGHNDQVIFVLILVKDVTRERVIQQRNKVEINNLERYRNITSNIRDALVLLDWEGMIHIWNEAARKYFILEKTSAQFHYIGDFVPLFTKDYFANISRTIKRKGHWDGEVTLLRNDTELMYLFVRMNVFHEESSSKIVMVCSDITEKAKVERRLKESEQKYREIVANTGEYICTLDLDYNITYTNPLLSKLLELNDDFSFKRQISDYIAFQNGNNVAGLIDSAISQQSAIEINLRTPSGDIIYTRAEFSLVKDFNGEPKYYIIVFHDISTIKQAEKDTLTFRALLGASSDGIAVVINNNIVEVNERFARLFGYEFKSEVLRHTPYDFIAEKDKILVENYFRNLQKDYSAPGEIEFLGVRRDGSTFNLKLNADTFYGYDGLYLVMIVRDITEEIRSKLKLHESEKKYQTISDKINVSMYTAEKIGRKLTVLFYTQAIENITGFAVEEFLADEYLWQKIIHPDDFDSSFKKLSRFYRDRLKSNERFEYRIFSKSGNVIWIENKVNAIRDAKGCITKIYGLISDISQSKHAEEELKKSAEDLQRLNETKDRFISIVSHDLRNPFNSILGYADMLLQRKDLTEDKREEFVKFIKESSTSLLELVNSLLDWTRLQTGRMKFEPNRLNARDVIDKSIRMLSGGAMNKDVTLYSTLERDAYVHADEGLLLQVLNNLVSNAIKFTDEGGRITLSAKPLYDKNVFQFVVSDSGTGIKPEDQEKLFKVDTKFTLKGTQGEKGSGLGLSLVKDIVEMHGGSIKVESLYGKGSDFIFTIPVSSSKVLLADGSKTDRILYSKLLSNLVPDYQVIEASGAEEAYNKILKNVPALVITEHTLLDGDGLKLVNQLAESPIKHKPKIIVLASGITEREKDEYKNMDIEFVFEKPVNLKVFKAAIEKSIRTVVYKS